MNLPKLLVFHANCVEHEKPLNEAIEALEKEFSTLHVNPEELTSDNQWDEALAAMIGADRVITV